MRFVFPVLLALVCSTQAFANKKTLFVDGVFAATYGDFTVDKGEWRGENFSALHVRAGVQVIRYQDFGLGIGFQKVGFYDAEKNWDRDSKDLRFDYRGPFAELYYVNDSLLGFTFSAMTGNGYSSRNLDDASAYGFTPSCTGCAIKVEHSELKISEFTGSVTLRLTRHLQLLFGAGSRQFTGRPKYQVENADGSTEDVRYPEGKWKDSGTFLSFGIRGTNL